MTRAARVGAQVRACNAGLVHGSDRAPLRATIKTSSPEARPEGEGVPTAAWLVQAAAFPSSSTSLEKNASGATPKASASLRIVLGRG